MNDNTPQPYTIEIAPVAKPAEQFTWAIRRGGKLIERSDRTYPSEAAAHEKALEAIEQDIRRIAARHGASLPLGADARSDR